MAIFRPHSAILVGNICFCPILIFEIDFYVQEESKYTIGNNGGTISEGGYPGTTLVKNGPNFHHFWNCGHIMPKHKTKIYMDHTSVMTDMCVKLEKTPNGPKMVKIANRTLHQSALRLDR